MSYYSEKSGFSFFLSAVLCNETESQETLTLDTAMVTDAVTRTRSRIVQSPERIKRSITAMGVTAGEDRKALAAQEAKARDLQTKVSAVLGIEKVSLMSRKLLILLTYVCVRCPGSSGMRRATPSR